MSDAANPLRTAARLVTSVEALAAVAALVRIDTEQLDADPGRRGGWQHDDPVLLQGIGRLSGSIADAFRVAADEVDGLDAAFTGRGARFLDVGTGAGWLAIATARVFPALAVVGLDIHEPALALARANVDAEQLADRVEIRDQDVTRLDEAGAYDVVWLPLPFLPETIVPAALAASARALRTDGWLVVGAFAGGGDRLSQLLADLRTVRAGGRAWHPDELPGLLAAAGFADRARHRTPVGVAGAPRGRPASLTSVLLVPVPDAAHGDDALRMGGVVLDLCPQPLHVHVEGLGVAVVVRSPHAVDEHVAGQDPPGVREQQLEELELLQRQRHLLPVDPHLVTSGVEAHVTDLEHVTLVDRACVVTRGRDGGPP